MAGKKPTVEILTTFKLSESSKKQLRESIKKALTLSSQDTKKILESLNSGLEDAAETFRNSMKKEIDEVSRHMQKAFGGSRSSGRSSSGGVGRSLASAVTTGLLSSLKSDMRSAKGTFSRWSTRRRNLGYDRSGYMHGSGEMASSWMNVRSSDDWARWRNRYGGRPGSGSNLAVSPTLGERAGDVWRATKGIPGAVGRRGAPYASGLATSLGKGLLTAETATMGAVGAHNMARGFSSMAEGYRRSLQTLSRFTNSSGNRPWAGKAGKVGSLFPAGMSGGIAAVTGYVSQAVQVAEQASEARIRALDAGARHTPVLPDAGGLGFTVNEQSALGMQMAAATGTTNKRSLRSVMLAQRLGGNAGSFTGMLGAMAQTGSNVSSPNRILGRVIGNAIDQGLKKGRWRELFVGFKQLAQATPLGVRYNQAAVGAMQRMVVGVTGGKDSPVGGIRSLQVLQGLNRAVSGGGGGVGQTLALLASGMGKGGMGYFQAKEEMQKGIFGEDGKQRLKNLIATTRGVFGSGGPGRDVLSQASGLPMHLAAKFLDPDADFDKEYGKYRTSKRGASQLHRMAVGKGSGMGEAGDWRRALLVNQQSQIKLAESLRPAIVSLRKSLSRLADTTLRKGGTIYNMLLSFITVSETVTKALNKHGGTIEKWGTILAGYTPSAKMSSSDLDLVIAELNLLNKKSPKRKKRKK